MSALLTYALVPLLLIAIHEGARWPFRARAVAPAIAGTVASYVFAVIVAFVYVAQTGYPVGKGRYQVAAVKEGYDAHGKLEVGDLITAIDHDSLYVEDWPGLVERVNRREGAAIVVSVERGTTKLDVTIQPTRNPDRTPKWLLGIRPKQHYDRDRGAGRAVGDAIVAPVSWVGEFVRSKVAKLTGGDVDPGGPMRIVDEYQVLETYPWLLLLSAWAAYAWGAYLLIDAVRLILALRRRRE